MVGAQDYLLSKKSDKRANDCSLADLGVQPVSREAAQRILDELPDKNQKLKAQLLQKHQAEFGQWLFELTEGFSLGFYGFGSKMALLEAFAKEYLSGAILAVHGMRSGVTARQVLLHAVASHQHQLVTNLRQKSDEELLKSIEEHPMPLTVLLHNIDGPGLRAPEQQALLSRLAACSNVCFMASYDHINTPTLWGPHTNERFNWRHHAVPTFERYSQELLEGNVQPLLAGTRAAQTNVASAVLVLRATPPRAREVFRIIGQQTYDADGPGGVTFLRLFRMCREKFLVGVESNLKAHLNEFRDHDLVQSRRAEDGSELLFVPLSEDALATVLREMMS